VYDERDHVCERRGRGGTITYRYNGRDQLSALDAPGLVYRAEHDALGRRVSKTAAGRTTRFYWDGDRLAAEVDADGALRVYVYPDEGALVPMLFVDYTSVDADPASGKVYEVFTDHLGTPERIRDADGNLVWQARIAPYGRAEILVGAGFHQPFRFPGHDYDAETGLHENRFRSYAPELGRYLQTDPIGLSGGTNLYAYTWNPLVDVDLRGLCPDDVPDCPLRPVTPDAEAPLDPNGRHGMPPHGQRIPERAARRPPAPPAPDPADIINNPRRYAEMRADEIAHARHPGRGETFHVQVVESVAGDPNSRHVVITSSIDNQTAPANIPLRPGEVYRNPNDTPRPLRRDADGETVLSPTTGRPLPALREPGDTRHHAEQRGARALQPGEVPVAGAPTRGCCPGCQSALPPDYRATIPVHRQTPAAYNAQRRANRRAHGTPWMTPSSE
jgi:RHS repeat-associated protein